MTRQYRQCLPVKGVVMSGRSEVVSYQIRVLNVRVTSGIRRLTGTIRDVNLITALRWDTQRAANSAEENHPSEVEFISIIGGSHADSQW